MLDIHGCEDRTEPAVLRALHAPWHAPWHAHWNLTTQAFLCEFKL